MQNSLNYTGHWDIKFQQREWGRYPPEDLVRFMARNFKHDNPNEKNVLEVGCGPGANLWFFVREGFNTSGIDISPKAIELAKDRIHHEVASSDQINIDLRVGNFLKLPWREDCFDAVVDNFAIYANPLEGIKKTISEIHRVLKSGGVGFSKFWGKNCTGYGSGVALEDGSFTEIESGPCFNMGLCHFVDEQELRVLFSSFDELTIEKVLKTSSSSDICIEEYLCQFKKNR